MCRPRCMHKLLQKNRTGWLVVEDLRSQRCAIFYNRTGKLSLQSPFRRLVKGAAFESKGKHEYGIENRPPEFLLQVRPGLTAKPQVGRAWGWARRPSSNAHLLQERLADGLPSTRHVRDKQRVPSPHVSKCAIARSQGCYMPHSQCQANGGVGSSHFAASTGGRERSPRPD